MLNLCLSYLSVCLCQVNREGHETACTYCHGPVVSCPLDLTRELTYPTFGVLPKVGGDMLVLRRVVKNIYEQLVDVPKGPWSSKLGNQGSKIRPTC